ncbi:MAG: UbiA family prenyltransferase, partial [Henriciella sp.]|uniref:UbiA family prenyltransferase n=1 Tax=Henriciella sp. TaxID=1968823 RepID=UPI003C7493E8
MPPRKLPLALIRPHVQPIYDACVSLLYFRHQSCGIFGKRLYILCGYEAVIPVNEGTTLTAASPSSRDASSAAPSAAQDILVVDLDRTLTATDFTLENVLAVLGHNPFNIAKLTRWALMGRSYLKARAAERIMPDVEAAPYNRECIAFIRAAKADGAYVVLATASNQKIADAVAAHIGLFDAVHGSSEGNNFKGSAKAEFLDRTYGRGNYTYMGDSPSDVKVWTSAKKAVTVGATQKVRSLAESAAPQAEHISLASGRTMSRPRALLNTIRPHQWSKNILVFVPLLSAQEFSLPIILNAVLAFICFSLTASSVYVLNDLLDLDADRAHPRKKNRPFASGALKIESGMWMAPLLLAAGFSLAIWQLPLIFVLVLVGYYALTLSYSFFLKRKIMVDVFTLAGLYTIRVGAGAAATLIALSPWLAGFALFFFLALAIVKRLSEVVDMISMNEA